MYTISICVSTRVNFNWRRGALYSVKIAHCQRFLKARDKIVSLDHGLKTFHSINSKHGNAEWALKVEGWMRTWGFY